MGRRREATIIMVSLALLVIAWIVETNNPWNSASFSVGAEPKTCEVFVEQLNPGSTLVYRLDLKPGANGRLILETPDGGKIEWDRPWAKGDVPAAVAVSQAGKYRMVLMTDPVQMDGSTPPEVEVNWRIK